VEAVKESDFKMSNTGDFKMEKPKKAETNKQQINFDDQIVLVRLSL
jgi:hypothetical protein